MLEQDNILEHDRDLKARKNNLVATSGYVIIMLIAISTITIRLILLL